MLRPLRMAKAGMVRTGRHGKEIAGKGATVRLDGAREVDNRLVAGKSRVLV